MAQISDDERCDGIAQNSDEKRCDGIAKIGTVVISNGKDRCCGAKKGHGTELRIDAWAISRTAGLRHMADMVGLAKA